jgi:hypothetical protein
MVYHVSEASIPGPMEIDTTVSGKMVNSAVENSIHGQTIIAMTGSGRTVQSVAKVR